MIDYLKNFTGNLFKKRAELSFARTTANLWASVVDEVMEMPIVWVTAQTLMNIWKNRLAWNMLDLHVTRTLLETRVNLLRETRFSSNQTLIQEIVDKML